MNHQDTKAKDFPIKFGNLPTKLAFNYNYGMTNNSIRLSVPIKKDGVVFSTLSNLDLVIKIEDNLQKEEEAKEKDCETYRKLDTKYEAQFDKLKEAEKLAQATEAANVDNFINNEYNEIEGEVA